MKRLACPQCGGKITEYSPLGNAAVCDYCSTRFVIEPEKQNDAFASPNAAPTDSNSSNPLNAIVLTGLLIFVLIGFLVLKPGKTKPTATSYDLGKYIYADPIASPTANVNVNAGAPPLAFGSTGTRDGSFQNACALAVDARGRIYVGDETLRVQQFDERGSLKKYWRIPADTKFFKPARGIQKIAVDEKDALYVLVGGTLLIYGNDDSGTPATLEPVSKSAVEDFVIGRDGRIFVVAHDGAIEKLFIFDKNREMRRSVRGFHTTAAAGAVSPAKSGLSAIRLAVDGAGSIYSIYALGETGGERRSYNREKLTIFRFTHEGKFVDRFVQTANSCGIEVDGQNRIYITDAGVIKVFTQTGEPLTTISSLPSAKAFALDRWNNIYVLSGDRVVRRAAI